MIETKFYRWKKARSCWQGYALLQTALAHCAAVCLLLSPVFSTITLAQEKNAAKKAFDEHGGNALKQNPIAPGLKTFDELGVKGSGKGQPGPTNGNIDPLGASSGATTAGNAFPTFAPPGIVAPPTVDFPLICPFCRPERMAFK